MSHGGNSQPKLNCLFNFKVPWVWGQTVVSSLQWVSQWGNSQSLIGSRNKNCTMSSLWHAMTSSAQTMGLQVVRGQQLPRLGSSVYAKVPGPHMTMNIGHIVSAHASSAVQKQLTS